MKKSVQLVMTLTMVTIMFVAACGQVAENRGVVPNSLQTIESAAEDIIDVAPGGNWDKINSQVSGIAEAWQSYQSQATKDGASQALQDTFSQALSELQAATAAQDTQAIMQSANTLSAAVVELFGIYNPAIPVDIGRLDVLERQVVLDVAANDYEAAATSLANVKSVWQNVKPSVLAHNGEQVAAEFENSIALQESALNAKDGTSLTSEAKNGLEIVDALEQLY